MLATARLGGSWYAWLVPGDFEEGPTFIESMRGSHKRKRNPRRGLRPARGKFDRCVADVSASGSALNPYAVCASSLKPRRKNPRIVFRAVDGTEELVGREFAKLKDAQHEAAAMNKRFRKVGGARDPYRVGLTQRRTNRRRRRNLTSRGSHGRLYSLIARKANAAPVVFTGTKFARAGKPALLPSLIAAKAIARALHRKYPALRAYSIWAREV